MDGIIEREEIRRLVTDFYYATHGQQVEFIPGQTQIKYAGRVFDEEELMNLVDASLDFWLTEGEYSKEFRKALNQFIGTEHCILCNSGSSANLLAISALTSPRLRDRQLKPGDAVITTACAFPTTVAPIIQNRLVPVFVDVGLGTYNALADKIKWALTPYTKAIFIAHTLGNPFDITEVLDIAKEYGLWVIEDNCDSLGATYMGQMTGTFGDMATLSFYPAHHISTGEGGAVITNDDKLADIVGSFRDWGRDCSCNTGQDNKCGKRFQGQYGQLPFGYDHKFVYSHIGYNLKMTDLQAAIGVAQMKKLPEFVQKRIWNWNLLYVRLLKYEEYFYLPIPTENSDPSWFGFVLTVRKNEKFERKDIVGFLEKNKIATRMLFAGNILRQPCFEGYQFTEQLPITDLVMNSTFWLGVYPGITTEMIDYIGAVFERFIKKGER